MMEPEQIKAVTLCAAAGVSQILGSVAGASSDDMISRWIERGGTGLCIVLLIVAVRTLRADGKELREKLDANAAKDKELLEASTESRVKMTVAMEKLTEVIESKIR
jgi:hypothetical protein